MGKSARARGGGGATDARKRWPRQEFSAGFVLYREGRAGRKWLVLDYGRHWDYPKGHLEKGETAWQAAVRELREETGIKQVDRVGKAERRMEYAFYSPKKGHVRKTVTYFVGQTRKREVRVSDEHEGFAWLPYEEALGKLTYGNARDMLRWAERLVSGRLSSGSGRTSGP